MEVNNPFAPTETISFAKVKVAKSKIATKANKLLFLVRAKSAK